MMFHLKKAYPLNLVLSLQLTTANKDLAQTSYFMATNSLHLTTMCLQYKPTVVACICIYFVCKWGDFEVLLFGFLKTTDYNHKFCHKIAEQIK